MIMEINFFIIKSCSPLAYNHLQHLLPKNSAILLQHLHFPNKLPDARELDHTLQLALVQLYELHLPVAQIWH